MKRILVISPIPTHPPVAGNRARIHNLLNALTEMGHDVHFLCVNTEPDLVDETRMAECWGKNFTFVPYRYPSRSLSRYAGRFKFLFERGFRHLQPVDYRYDPSLDEVLKRLAGEITFDVVIVEYIFWSKALECFPQGVLKIIDTLDVFTRRHLWYLERGQTYGWYCTTAAEEAKALNRADVIVAIQEKEQQFFSTLTNKRVITVGHIAPLVKLAPRASTSQKILFIGSDSAVNRHAVQEFTRDVLPRIRSVLPGVELLLAGRICDFVGEPEGCTKLGRVDDLASIYNAADLVINPIHFSTGLSIKTIEALGRSKPVVVMPAGSRGLEDGAGKAFLVAEDGTLFADSVIKVLSNRDLSLRLSEAAYEFVARWNHKNLEELAGILK